MHRIRTRLRHGALTACAAALALLAAGCSKASAGAQTGGCRADSHWSGRERAAWLRTAVTFHGTAGGADRSYEGASVVVGARDTGDVRPLCGRLAVQIEFWTLTATTAGTEMSSVMRYRLTTDGSRTRTVAFPTGLPTGQDGACPRVLVAAYAGGPLTSGELPRKTRDLATAGDADVRFRTERIGAYRMLPSRVPARCATNPPPTGPAPTRSANWDVYHP